MILKTTDTLSPDRRAILMLLWAAWAIVSVDLVGTMWTLPDLNLESCSKPCAVGNPQGLLCRRHTRHESVNPNGAILPRRKLQEMDQGGHLVEPEKPFEKSAITFSVNASVGGVGGGRPRGKSLKICVP